MAKVKKIKRGWQADFFENGIRRRKSFNTKIEAEKFIAGKKFFENSDNDVHRVYNFQSLTFKELAEKYINEHLSKSKSPNNKSYINILIKKWGDVKIHRLNVCDIENWFENYLRNENQDHKLSVSSIKKLLAYFKRVFNWGIKKRLIHKNPITDIYFTKEFRRLNKRDITLTTEEFQEFYQSFKEAPDYVRHILLATWYTGVRVGELLKIRWKNVRLESGLIKLTADLTKENKEKTIGLEKELLVMLRGLRAWRNPDQSDHVFINEIGKQVTYNSLYNHYKRYRAKSDYKNVNIHDFRHSFTRRKRLEGFDQSTIMAQQGHQTNSMFHWYNSVKERELLDMCGFFENQTFLIQNDIHNLVLKAKENDISLGALHNAIGRIWNKSKNAA